MTLTAVAAVTAGATVAVGLQGAGAAGGLTVSDLAHGTTAQDLAQSLAGTGVSISNVTYTGAPNAAGVFTSGADSVGIGGGVVMSTGSVQTLPGADPCSKGVEGPNQCDANTTANNQPGDPDLTTLSGVATYDAAVLEFDFVPAGNQVQFKYVFGSDEYPEYANTQFNDTFAFLVNGTNCALVPGTTLPVGVNTINGGNPLGTNPQHAEYYVDNHYVDGTTSARNTEPDGLTTVLTCTAAVTAGQTNHMKLAIADGSDDVLDSVVFLAADSLVSGTQIATTLSGGGQSGTAITVPAGTAVTDQATLSGTNTATASGSVTYSVHTDAACTSAAVATSTVAVSNGVPAPSAAQTLTAGTYYWQASYSGDAANNAVTGACDEVLTVSPPANQPPTGSAGGPYTGTEGSPTTLAGTASDPESDPLTTTWTAAPGAGVDAGASCSFGDAHSLTSTVTCTDDGSWTLTLTIDDGHNPPVTRTATLTVANANPAVTITAPADMAVTSVGATVALSATVTDPGSNDTQTCTVDWGDGTTGAGTLSAGVCTASHSYAATGVYTVTVTATDDDGGVGTDSITLVVADQTSKVTGGGFVVSTGRVSFGFVANRLPDGALSGQIEIHGPGKQRFHGSTVTALTTSGNTATWTGTGSWGGTPGYTFTVSVVDNGQGGGKQKTPDSITLTVRGPGGATVLTAGGPLKGGNIVVHQS